MITPIKIKGPNMALVNRMSGFGKRWFNKIVWGDKYDELTKWEQRPIRETEFSKDFNCLHCNDNGCPACDKFAN